MRLKGDLLMFGSGVAVVLMSSDLSYPARWRVMVVEGNDEVAKGMVVGMDEPTLASARPAFVCGPHGPAIGFPTVGDRWESDDPRWRDPVIPAPEV